MKAADYVLIFIIALLAVVAIICIIRQRKKGNGCCGQCKCCSLSESCSKHDKGQ